MDGGFHCVNVLIHMWYKAISISFYIDTDQNFTKRFRKSMVQSSSSTGHSVSVFTLQRTNPLV